MNRPSTAGIADRVLVMSGGHVVENGMPRGCPAANLSDHDPGASGPGGTEIAKEIDR